MSFSHKFSFAFAAIGLLLASAPARLSHAQFGFLYEWNKPGGGAYAVNSNWTPSGIPNAANEGALFGLNASYTVDLPASNVTVGSLEVAQGSVGLRFATAPNPTPPYSYTAIDGLTVGSTGEAFLGFGSVSGFDQAQLNTGPTVLGVSAGSVGQMVFNNVERWASEATIIGAAGSGRLEVLESAIATATSAALGQSAGGAGIAKVEGDWETGDLIVGDAGSGEITLGTLFSVAAEVGHLRSDMASIAAQPASTGVVNVVGVKLSGGGGGGGIFTNSDWNVAESLSIGGTSATPGGAGRMVIGFRNQVVVGDDLKIWPSGTVQFLEGGEFTVSGAASLNGAFEFSFSTTSNPTLGYEYEVLSAAGGVTGAFSSTQLPSLPDGFAWSVVYNPSSVVLKVVSLEADFDNDGDVDSADLAQWGDDFGRTGGATKAQGNADGDADVDGADFLTWQRQFGLDIAATPATRSVPEPGALVLLTLVLVVFHKIGVKRPA